MFNTEYRHLLVIYPMDVWWMDIKGLALILLHVARPVEVETRIDDCFVGVAQIDGSAFVTLFYRR